ncbi:hypothetical protein B0O99DRAFT_336751 [Bisporella sp. PMI_857]|nr:hypothetical protein B0O99DRAFT_336751 [Bisporella sp. PMI_857]
MNIVVIQSPMWYINLFHPPSLPWVNSNVVHLLSQVIFSLLFFIANQHNRNRKTPISSRIIGANAQHKAGGSKVINPGVREEGSSLLVCRVCGGCRGLNRRGVLVLQIISTMLWRIINCYGVKFTGLGFGDGFTTTCFSLALTIINPLTAIFVAAKLEPFFVWS